MKKVDLNATGADRKKLVSVIAEALDTLSVHIRSKDLLSQKRVR